jgi:hypothetical protein
MISVFRAFGPLIQEEAAAHPLTFEREFSAETRRPDADSCRGVSLLVSFPISRQFVVETFTSFASWSSQWWSECANHLDLL